MLYNSFLRLIMYNKNIVIVIVNDRMSGVISVLVVVLHIIPYFMRISVVFSSTFYTNTTDLHHIQSVVLLRHTLTSSFRSALHYLLH